MTPAAADYEIPLRVSIPARLFHSLDPSPFRERDLDADALDFILGWAREAPEGVPFSIVVHLPATECRPQAVQDIVHALHNNFAYRTDKATRDLRELFREGRRALAIGMPVLALSLMASQFIAQHVAPSTFAAIVGESLLILGWVANWRPIEIFLYDWWPILRRRNLCRRLAAARVEVRPVRT